MSKYIYFHIWDNHFKMWGYDCFQDGKTGNVRIIFYWGKIADTLQKLQQKEKEMNFFDAHDLIRKKTQEKLLKGYVALSGVDYTKYACGEISLSQLINMIEKQREVRQ